MVIVKGLMAGLLLIAMVTAARADDAADFETYARPKLTAFVDCVAAGEPAAAKTEKAAPDAADAAIGGCADKLEAFKAVLLLAPLNGTQADADDAARGVLETIRPKVIKRIGEIRGAL